MHMRSVVFTLLFTLCAFRPAARAGADGAPSPWFHAPFDGTRAAVVDGADVAPLNQGEYAYEDGPIGRAIVIAEAPVIFKEDPAFPLAQGTLAFWLKPDWLPGLKNHWIFKKWTAWERSPVNGLWCISGTHPGSIVMASGGPSLYWQYLPKDRESEWEAGTWRHFALTWNRDGARMYVNGALVDLSEQCDPPAEHAEQFYLGGKHNYYGGKIGMDDLRIYRQVLDRRQVEELYAMGAPRFQTGPPRRRNVLAEAVVAREFSRIYEGLQPEGAEGAPFSPVDFAVQVRRRFERFLDAQAEFDADEVRAMRARLEAVLRNVIGIPRADSKPVLDGRVTEEEWRDAARIKGFWEHKSARRVWRDTTVNLVYDDKNLYLGAVLEEYPGDKVIATFHERDGKIWRNDALEILIRSQPEQGRDPVVYHFIVNALDACFDRKGADAAWNSNIEIGAVYGERDDRWSVELAIPFADLGVVPAPGTLIRANVARENVDKDIVAWKHDGVLEVSSWAPVPTSLDDPNTFGVLVLQGPEQENRLTRERPSP